MECSNIVSKHDFGSFCTCYSHSCSYNASKYDLVQGYAVHVRRILATEVFQSYLEPILQHETMENLQSARIWPLSSSHNHGSRHAGK